MQIAAPWASTAILVMTSSFLAGCVVPQVRQGSASSPTAGTSSGTMAPPGQAVGQTQSGYPKIGQTPLKNVLAESKGGDAKNAGFPRVALRVTGVQGTFNRYSAGSNSCVLFSATLWHSSAKSEEIKGFEVCNADLNDSPYTIRSKARSDGMQQIVYNEYSRMQWLDWTGTFGESRRANTGYKRTSGPVSPRFAIDKDAMNLPAWQEITLGNMVAHLGYAMRNMGFLMREDFEWRFWIVSAQFN